MCGIAGFLGRVSSPYNVLNDMAQALVHRGPDAQDFWFDEKAAIGLAHARLSILDLSSAGKQPMHSRSGRYVIVFNGEIYNHTALRDELELSGSRMWNGHSDTETLLEGIETWGLKSTLTRLVGMFSIALWDVEFKTLTLARDRMGEKPLYYGWVADSFVFSSELKSLRSVPNFNNQICRDSLSLYLRYSSIPAPYSIYDDIFKLEPGCFATIKLDERTVERSEYWSTEAVLKNGLKHPFSGSEYDAVDVLDKLLKDAVNQQMQADVPLGAFLSGGIDSSTIVALMQEQASSKVKTFSIGFDDELYNEAEHARDVAKYLGTEHHDMYVSGRDALKVIPSLPNIYDEPFSDSSQIPTYLVSKIAKQKVTVSLSGDAGDELFGGYSRYKLANNAWNNLNRIPSTVRHTVGKGIALVPENIWRGLFSPINLIVRNMTGKPISYSDKFLKASALLGCKTRTDFYHKGFISHNLHSDDWVLGASSLPTIFDSSDFSDRTFIEEMMALDMIHYLPTDILTKVDRAGMAVSLETRMPFLTPEVVEFSASLPLNYKIRGGVNKWVLREVLYKRVPKELVERPKMGFGVPLSEWLRGPLREWAETLLNEGRLQSEGFFNVTLVRKAWTQHLSGSRNWSNKLWDILVFQAWLENNRH